MDACSHGADADVHPVQDAHHSSMQTTTDAHAASTAVDVAHTQSPPPLQRKRGRPRAVDAAKDRLIWDTMQTRGTTNARMIRDELAQKHSVVLAYEVVRKRVKALQLQSATDATSDSAPSLSAAAPPPPPAASLPSSVAQSKTSRSDAPKARHVQIAHDLDMLAETVRTIVHCVPDAADDASDNDDGGGADGVGDTSTDLSAREICELPASETADAAREDDGAPTTSTICAQQSTERTPAAPARGQHGEYSLEMCRTVVSKSSDGKTLRQIATELSMPVPSVQTIIQKAKRKGAVLPAQRPGRPRATSKSLEQAIRAIVSATPTMSARAVQTALATQSPAPLDVSFETIRRRVRDCKAALQQADGAPADQPVPVDEATRHQDEGHDDGGVSSASSDDISDNDDEEKPATRSAAPDCEPQPDESERAAETPTAGASDSTLQPKTRRRKYGEYSTELRQACVHKHEREGLTYAAISRQLSIPHDTVRAIVRKARKTGSVCTAPRSGRPRKTSDLVDRVILQAVKANQRCTAKMIQEDLFAVFNVQVSCETVRRRVKANAKQRLVASEASTTAFPSITDAAPAELQRGSLPGVVSTSAMSAPLPVYERQHSTGIHTLLNDTSVSDRAWSQLSASSSVDSVEPQTETATAPARKRRTDYSVEVREQCVAMHAQGLGYRRIGQELLMPHTTVRAIVEKVQRTGSVLPAARSGRPRKTDELVDRVILQAVKQNEKSSARVIQAELETAYGVYVSCETIRRRVKDHSRQRLGSVVANGTADDLFGADALAPSLSPGAMPTPLSGAE